MMKKQLITTITALGLGLAMNAANAGIVFFTGNPSGNSTDWTNSVTGAGATVNSNVDFAAHGSGTLNTTFYAGSDGVTINSSGTSNQFVTFGAGPGQGNTSGAQPGEGVHPSSHYLLINNAGTLTVSFDEGVIGTGIFTIDEWTNSNFTVRAFSGQNGTGTLLGTQSNIAAGLNFQRNGLFFMGVQTDDSTLIGSVQYFFNAQGGDDIGYDNILFATGTPVPAPAPIMLVLLGLAGIFARSRRLHLS